MDRNRTHKQRKGEIDSDLIIEILEERERDRQTDRGDRQTQAEMDKVTIHLGKSPTRVNKNLKDGSTLQTKKSTTNPESSILIFFCFHWLQ